MNELSLFSGAGGGLLGTKLLGFTAVGYVEWNKYCCQVLEQRIKDRFLDDAPIFNCDIREWIRLGYAASYQGLVDVITAGFPCQPFSVAGKQRGGTDRQNMWPATIRTIRLVRPRYALLENVPNLLSYRYFGTILRTLADSGYDARWCVLSAASLGAPHKRNRLWILAENKRDQIDYTNGVGLPRREKGEFRWKQESQPWQNNGSITDICERFDIPSPLISGMGNGMADRVERTRATGNGQVPSVVQAAWTLLSGLEE
jgi:DNA (cytosine-5)-methyltransferase 1